MKCFFISIAGLLICLTSVAQMQPIFTHYSVDDGLSENNVMCMLQDRKGILWMGTYDGLNRFDGYTFRNFKGKKRDTYRLLNYRVDRICEDHDGYLWVQTTDGRVYRFDTTTETFMPVPQCEEKYKEFNKPLKNIKILEDGSVWLLNKKAGEEECFRITNTPSTKRVSIAYFTKNNGSLSSNGIHNIYLDGRGNSWILTATGVNLLKKGAQRPITLLKENERGANYSILESNGTLFIGGEQGKLRRYTIRNNTFENIQTPFTQTIIDIKKINNSELLLLTNQRYFYTYHLKQGVFHSYLLNAVAGDTIYGCYQDKHHNIWIDTQYTGAVLFQSLEKRINYLPVQAQEEFPSNFLPELKVIEDRYNNTWVWTKHIGLWRYNSQTNGLESFYNDANSSERRFSNLLHTALSDRQGNLWLSTYSQGIDKIVFKQSQFTFTKPYNEAAYTSKSEVRSIFQDSKNWLWVGSRKGYVYLYDDKRHYKGILATDGKIDGKQPLHVPVFSIFEDHSGTIWLASKGMGLFKVNRLSIDRFKLTNYQYDAKDIYSISSNAVYSLYEDPLHRIWVATFGGGINVIDTTRETLRFISSRNQLNNYPIEECAKVRYITGDRQGNLFAGTTQGLLICSNPSAHPQKMVFKRYCHNNNDHASISGNDVQYILPTRHGDLYLALFGGGLNMLKGPYNFNKETPRFTVFNKHDGTFSNVIYTLKEDNKGCVWMSTQTKIVKYDPGLSKFDLYKPSALNSYFFIEAAACKTQSGELLYGTSEGFISFDPIKIRKSSFIPRICFTQLQLANIPVEVGEKDSPLSTLIDDTHEIVLNHKQSIFSIEYAALDYTYPQGIQYAYKLEGLETEWNYVGNQRIATYTNLPKGKYIFHVKSTNADGEWVENEKSIVIVKKPSFWESFWGILFYIILFLMLMWLITYVWFTIYRLRNEVTVEQHITQMKLRFFTDISHELRTPLTLIASPVENLLKREPLSPNAKEQLQIMQRNTDRMLRLINQILDFRKIQNKKMELIVEEVEMGSFIHEVCLNFQKLAEERNIRLQIVKPEESLNLWVDRDKMEKIIFNLLSNAFKFSQSHTAISLTIDHDTDHLLLTIKDQGVGISKDRMRLIFERFESFTGANFSFQPSTGIGLSLTKELVELHHARIEVDSEDGKGTSFTLIFKKGVQHFHRDKDFIVKTKDSTITLSKESNSIASPDNADSVLSPVPDQPIDPVKILLVEDNAELRTFLKSVLSHQYEIYEAENGRQALDIALKNAPDVIVSDIMMPDMDGLELARTVKNDINISHIPMILLTAKTDIESKLEALEYGVDDYIAKPFSPTYLEARIENILKIRRQLQLYYRNTLTSGVISLSKPQVTNQDELFIQRTMAFVERNIDNTELNIDDIANEIGVSRSSFFRKLKTLTGFGPNEFVREVRIRRAVQLIEAGESNISQIAYSVGMNDPRHFSKCFKLKYGITPTEYKEKVQREIPRHS